MMISGQLLLKLEDKRVTVEHSEQPSQDPGVPKARAQDENEEHEHRLEELEKQSIEWLQERARTSGIPDWKQLTKEDLLRRLSDSSAPPH